MKKKFDIGLPDTNVEGDLKVEHQNLELKTGLINLAGKLDSKNCHSSVVCSGRSRDCYRSI